MTMALAYLLSLLVAAVVLAVALRRRPVPTPPPNAPAESAGTPLPAGTEADVRLILVAATHLAARLATAA